ncbi:MAG: TSUP family transporter [Polyangiaceae bacterium]
MPPIVLVPMGVLAGLLTTIAGMGGGMLLLLAISATRGIHEALAITAPALLVSNLHRAVLYRREFSGRVAGAFSLGAAPGAILGGIIVPAIPTWVLNAILIGLTILALARARGWFAWSPSSKALIPAGFGIGFLTATAGGAGLLVGPLFLASGLRGSAYVATVSVAAVALHVSRLVGYSVSGLLRPELLLPAGLLVVGLLLGNLFGRSLRGRLSQETEIRIELGTLVTCTTLAVLGIVR